MPHDLLSLAQDMLVSLVLEDPQAFSSVCRPGARASP